MDVLRQKIWDKLRGNIKAKGALTAAENGSKPAFAQAMVKIVQTIHHALTQVHIDKVQGAIPHLSNRRGKPSWLPQILTNSIQMPMIFLLLELHQFQCGMYH